MNDALAAFARDTLKDGLAKCTSGQQDVFKRMYAFNHRDWPIGRVVDEMDDDKLDRAMEQVQATLDKAKS